MKLPKLPPMTWPPSPAAILAYIAIVATLAALISGGVALRQATQNKNRIDDITDVQAKLCNAVQAISDGQNRNTEERLTQNEQFAQSPQVAAAFGLTLEELKSLSAQSRAADLKLVADIKHAVALACG